MSDETMRAVELEAAQINAMLESSRAQHKFLVALLDKQAAGNTIIALIMLLTFGLIFSTEGPWTLSAIAVQWALFWACAKTDYV